MNIHITVDKEYNCVFGTWSFPLRDLNRTMDENLFYTFQKEYPNATYAEFCAALRDFEERWW